MYREPRCGARGASILGRARALARSGASGVGASFLHPKRGRAIEARILLQLYLLQATIQKRVNS